jgi:hypothetical protein
MNHTVVAIDVHLGNQTGNLAADLHCIGGFQSACSTARFMPSPFALAFGALQLQHVKWGKWHPKGVVYTRFHGYTIWMGYWWFYG